MKILYIINSFDRAGAENLVFNLSLKIKNMNQDISVAALYRTGQNAEKEMCGELNNKGINTYILDKRAGRNRIKTVVKLMGIIRKEKPDVIHAHCSVPMLMGKLAGFFCGVPVICTVHSTRGYRAVREVLTSWMAKAYVAIGESAENYMKDSLHVSAGKIIRIYNGVDMTKFSEGMPTEGFWKDSGLACRKPVMLNVGRVSPPKNQLCFVKAIKECVDRGADVQGAILGAFDNDDIYSSLRAYIDDNGLGNRVVFLGNRENVTDYLNNAECFVMTSVFEGLSVAYLEAAACNVPIITTDLPFVHEIEKISPGSVIVAQNDAAALADAICTHKYDKRTNESVNNLKQTFSIEAFAKKHFDLYKEVITGRP